MQQFGFTGYPIVGGAQEANPIVGHRIIGQGFGLLVKPDVGVSGKKKAYCNQ